MKPADVKQVSNSIQRDHFPARISEKHYTNAKLQEREKAIKGLQHTYFERVMEKSPLARTIGEKYTTFNKSEMKVRAPKRSVPKSVEPTPIFKKKKVAA